MTDLAVTLLFAVAGIFLVVVLSAGLATEHTNTQLPPVVTYGQGRRRVGRRALLVEVPVMAVVVGTVSLILAGMLVHANSTWAVRIVAASALVAIWAWCVFLARRVWRAR